MTLQELNEMVDSLANLRRIKDEAKEAVGVLRAEFEAGIADRTAFVEALEDDIAARQEAILAALRESGNKSWKTEKATVSRKSSLSYKVADKARVMAYLSEKGLADEYTTVELAPHIKSLYESQDVPGVEKVEKEYISVLAR